MNLTHREAAEGEVFDRWLVTEGGNPIAVEADSFTMPANPVEVTAGFLPALTADQNGQPLPNSEADVPPTAQQYSVSVEAAFQTAEGKAMAQPADVQSVSLEILANGEPSGNILQIPADPQAAVPLPETDSLGQKITYTVKPVSIPEGFTAPESVPLTLGEAGFTGAVTYRVKKETLKAVVSQWQDEQGQPLEEIPENLTVTAQVLREDTVVASLTLLKTDSGYEAAAELPMRDAEGRLCSYRVIFAAPAGYQPVKTRREGQVFSASFRYAPEKTVELTPRVEVFNGQNRPDFGVSVFCDAFLAGSTEAGEVFRQKLELRQDQPGVLAAHVTVPREDSQGQTIHYRMELPETPIISQESYEVVFLSDLHVRLHQRLEVYLWVGGVDHLTELPVQAVIWGKSVTMNLTRKPNAYGFRTTFYISSIPVPGVAPIVFAFPPIEGMTTEVTYQNPRYIEARYIPAGTEQMSVAVEFAAGNEKAAGPEDRETVTLDIWKTCAGISEFFSTAVVNAGTGEAVTVQIPSQDSLGRPCTYTLKPSAIGGYALPPEQTVKAGDNVTVTYRLTEEAVQVMLDPVLASILDTTASVTVRMLLDGKVLDTLELTGDSPSGAFKPVPLYGADGKRIAYEVEAGVWPVNQGRDGGWTVMAGDDVDRVRLAAECNIQSEHVLRTPIYQGNVEVSVLRQDAADQWSEADRLILNAANGFSDFRDYPAENADGEKLNYKMQLILPENYVVRGDTECLGRNFSFRLIHKPPMEKQEFTCEYRDCFGNSVEWPDQDYRRFDVQQYNQNGQASGLIEKVRIDAPESGSVGRVVLDLPTEDVNGNPVTYGITGYYFDYTQDGHTWRTRIEGRRLLCTELIPVKIRAVGLENTDLDDVRIYTGILDYWISRSDGWEITLHKSWEELAENLEISLDFAGLPAGMRAVVDTDKAPMEYTIRYFPAGESGTLKFVSQFQAPGKTEGIPFVCKLDIYQNSRGVRKYYGTTRIPENAELQFPLRDSEGNPVTYTFRPSLVDDSQELPEFTLVPDGREVVLTFTGTTRHITVELSPDLQKSLSADKIITVNISRESDNKVLETLQLTKDNPTATTVYAYNNMPDEPSSLLDSGFIGIVTSGHPGLYDIMGIHSHNMVVYANDKTDSIVISAQVAAWKDRDGNTMEAPQGMQSVFVAVERQIGSGAWEHWADMRLRPNMSFRDQLWAPTRTLDGQTISYRMKPQAPVNYTLENLSGDQTMTFDLRLVPPAEDAVDVEVKLDNVTRLRLLPGDEIQVEAVVTGGASSAAPVRRTLTRENPGCVLENLPLYDSFGVPLKHSVRLIDDYGTLKLIRNSDGSYAIRSDAETELLQAEITGWQDVHGKPLSPEVDQVIVEIYGKTDGGTGEKLGQLLLTAEANWKASLEVPTENLSGQKLTYELRPKTSSGFQVSSEKTDGGSLQLVMEQKADPSEKPEKGDAPGTGDTQNPVLWITVSLISLACLCILGVAILRKKKK